MSDAIQILLVEDNPDDVELTLDALSTNKVSNKIHVVRDGAEAVDFLFCTGTYADREPNKMPKLVLLDLKLPKIDGLEVLRIIKNDARTRRVPVVMLTSSRQENDIVSSYDFGVNGYIVKPVDFQHFNEAVRTLGLFWLLINEPPPNPA